MGRYCSLSVWNDDVQNFASTVRSKGFSLSLFGSLIRDWLNFRLVYDGLRVAEWSADLRAKAVKLHAWTKGLGRSGFRGAHEAAAGLVTI